MAAVAEFYRKTNITFTSFQTDTSAFNMTDNLRREAGLDHASKFNLIRSILIMTIVYFANLLNLAYNVASLINNALDLNEISVIVSG